MSKLIVVPFGRTGWSSLQNGPRIADTVRPFELFVAAENVMSSTSVHSVSTLGPAAFEIVEDL